MNKPTFFVFQLVVASKALSHISRRKARLVVVEVKFDSKGVEWIVAENDHGVRGTFNALELQAY